MDVFWLEQRQSDVPESDVWFGARELACLNALNFPKRRADWRLGRWTAKQTIATHLQLGNTAEAFARIEIIADAGGRPEAFLSGQPSGLAISLSHRSGVGACAVTDRPAAIGCDLELVELRSEAFLTDFFTKEEAALIASAEAQSRARLATLLWSAKESALKAIGEGLRMDTRSVSVIHFDAEDTSSWNALAVRSDTGKLFEGWWREADGIVRTALAYPAPSVPICFDTGR